MNVTAFRLLVRATAVAALAMIVLPSGHLTAQRESAAPAAGKVAADGKKILTLADYGPWKRITQAALSDDGRWMTYTYAPNDGDDTLFVKQLDGDTLYTIDIGSATAGGRGGAGRGGAPGGGGGAVQFSDDGHWIGYTVNPPGAAPGRGRGGAGGGAGARGAGGRAGAPARGAGGEGAGGAGNGPTRHFELLDLATGAKYDVPNAGAFQFSKDSQWLAIKMNATAPAQPAPADGGAAAANAPRGTDLVLRKLATGATTNIGNVGQYGFDDAGTRLAYTVDAAGRLGNGVYLSNLATGETHALDNSALEYDALAWGDSGHTLLALRGETPKGKTQRENALVVWADATAAAPQAMIWDPSTDTTFPQGFVLSEDTAPRWSRDGAQVFVGIKAQSDTRTESNDANLDIWHWNDAEIQSEQILRVGQERRATMPAVFAIGAKHFIRLTENPLETVTPTSDGRWAIGRDPVPYAHDFSEGQPARADFYKVDTATGAHTLLAKHLLRTMGASSDGHWFFYLQGEVPTVVNLDTGKTQVIGGADAARFINSDDDHAADKALRGVAGWSKDGKSVLLDDKYDVWSVPLDGGKAIDLTGGAGAAQQVELHLIRLGVGGGGRGGGRGGGGGANDDGVDTSQPQTFTAYGEWTKKSGYWQAPAGGGQPKPLIWADASIGGVVKAKNADRVIFTRQTFQEFPDYWLSDSTFASPRKITDANPQIADYAWGSRVLVDFTNSKGKKLQATLTLPAGYQPGKKYPMLVYIYETLSNTHHEFSAPVYDDRPHMSEYASDGYLVLEPDIVYEIGKPGSSALDCVTAAVKKTIDLGYADPAHIGLQGHSWGGYESSFILTQTNIFAAVVTGAPLTDLISMYGEIYKQSGAWNGGILETSQGRMGADVTPWNAKDLYESQSPLFNVTKIQTPFMILQGTADGAVDWDQGLEFYTAARKNGKHVIFLSYPDEPHHLAKTPNQKDFQVRMKQFFDHYLKGGPEPDWMKNGLSQVDKGAIIR